MEQNTKEFREYLEQILKFSQTNTENPDSIKSDPKFLLCLIEDTTKEALGKLTLLENKRIKE